MPFLIVLLSSLILFVNPGLCSWMRQIIVNPSPSPAPWVSGSPSPSPFDDSDQPGTGGHPVAFDDDDNDGLSSGAIAGIVISGVFAAVVLVVAILVVSGVCSRKQVFSGSGPALVHESTSA